MSATRSSSGTLILDRILDNPDLDYLTSGIENAKRAFAIGVARFAKPANPHPFRPLGLLAGDFTNPSFGQATVSAVDGALVMEIAATGARLRLEPWDGDVFAARLMPEGRFGPIVDLDYMVEGFAEFIANRDGKLDVLTITLRDGQRFEFRRG